MQTCAMKKNDSAQVSYRGNIWLTLVDWIPTSKSKYVVKKKKLGGHEEKEISHKISKLKPFIFV